MSIFRNSNGVTRDFAEDPRIDDLLKRTNDIMLKLKKLA